MKAGRWLKRLLGIRDTTKVTHAKEGYKCFLVITHSSESELSNMSLVYDIAKLDLSINNGLDWVRTDGSEGSVHLKPMAALGGRRTGTFSGTLDLGGGKEAEP